MRARTADQIRDIAGSLAARPVPVGELIDRLGSAGTGLCLLILGLTSLVPGIAPVLGVPLCTIAAGVALGRTTPFVPGRLRRWTLDGGRLSRGLGRLAPKIAWLERWLAPRAPALTQGAGQRVAGAAALVNGILVVLPIPFGNTAPAVATIVLALGLVTRDGVAVGAGLALTALALVVDIALVGLGFAAVSGLVNSIL